MSDKVIILVLAILPLALFMLYWFVFRKPQTNYQAVMTKVLGQHTKAELKSVLIPDGLDGYIEIEHCVLIKQGILIIETVNMSGNIFAAKEINQWTQIKDGRSYSFVNPLEHLYHSKHAVQTLLPEIPIFSRLIFTGDCQFPKGQPDEVLAVEQIEEDLSPILFEGKSSIHAEAAWHKLFSSSVDNAQSISRKKAEY